MSGGGDTTVQTTASSPWATQQPYLAQGFAAAENLLKNNVPQYYPNSTIADPSQYRQEAINGAWNLGADGTREAAALSRTGLGLLNQGAGGVQGAGTLRALAGGGFGPGATAGGAQSLAGANTTARLANGAFAQPSPVAGGAADLRGFGTLAQTARGGLLDSAAAYGARDLAGAGTLAQTARGDYLDTASPISRAGDLRGTGMLAQTARGDFLTDQNPYFQQVVNQSIQAARPGIDGAFAASGRLGSGAHAAAFADAATRIGAELGYQDYARERGFQQQAQQALPQLDLAASAQGMQGRQFERGLQQGAAQQLGSMDLAARGASEQSRQFERGLQQGAAQQLGQLDLNAYGQAQQGRQFDTATIAQAAQNLGNLDLSALGLGQQWQQFGLGLQNQAAQQLANTDLQAMGAGAGMAQYGDQDAYRRLGLLGNVADYTDSFNQKLLDADIARFNFGQQSPWDAVQRYMGMVGGQQWGGTGTGSQTFNPSAGSQAAQWASLAMQLGKYLF